MLLALLALIPNRAETLLADATYRLRHAQTISLTVITGTDEIPNKIEPLRAFYAADGYYRFESKSSVELSNRRNAWQYSPLDKTYQVAKPLSSVNDFLSRVGIDILYRGLKATGIMDNVKWEGHNTTCIQLGDDRAIEVYLDPNTHLPVGVAYHGDSTIYQYYDKLVVNEYIPASQFQFVPTKAWRQTVPASEGSRTN